MARQRDVQHEIWLTVINSSVLYVIRATTRRFGTFLTRFVDFFPADLANRDYPTILQLEKCHFKSGSGSRFNITICGSAALEATLQPRLRAYTNHMQLHTSNEGQDGEPGPGTVHAEVGESEQHSGVGVNTVP
jgi:hypothetical protein